MSVLSRRVGRIRKFDLLVGGRRPRFIASCFLCGHGFRLRLLLAGLKSPIASGGRTGLCWLGMPVYATRCSSTNFGEPHRVLHTGGGAVCSVAVGILPSACAGKCGMEGGGEFRYARGLMRAIWFYHAQDEFFGFDLTTSEDLRRRRTGAFLGSATIPHGHGTTSS